MSDACSDSGPSTTRWARSRCPPTRCGGRRRRAPSRTSRSAGSRCRRASSTRSPASRPRPPTVNAELGVLDAGPRPGHRRGGRRGRGRRARRRVPHRRLPDRVRHLDEHERQRGRRPARAPREPALDVHPNDHVNAGQSSNDTFPSALRIAADVGRRRSTSSRPSSTSRRRWAARSRSSPTSSRRAAPTSWTPCR